MAPSSNTVDFAILNAFTTSTFGGNPAAVVFLDAPLPPETLLKIAQTFCQPITAFVFPVVAGTGVGAAATPQYATLATFGMRWFTGGVEIPLCGHGTLAAAHALFTEPGRLPAGVEELAFETMRGTVGARAAPGGRVEIRLPLSGVVRVGADEWARVARVVARAFGRDVGIAFIGAGEQMKEYLLVELDPKENLKDAVVDTAALTGTDPYVVNIITQASSDSAVAWETRMFAPKTGVQEDHVCGSANCLLGPYWAKKRGNDSGAEMFAKQVSARGGDLWVTVEEEKQTLRLRGEVKLVAKGKLYLDAQ